jgi:site-specific DNA-methyltransferase (adenine-specific)
VKHYYQDGSVTIYHGDARDIVPQLSGVDCVVTDPPYGIGFAGKRTKDSGGRRPDLGYAADFVDDPEYVRTIVVPLIEQCRARFNRVVLTPGCRNMWLYPQPDDVGCVFNPSGGGLGPWGFACFHPVLYYGKCPYLANGMGHRPNGIYDVSPGDGQEVHPCPKPIRWMRWLVQKASLEGELIIDPFMGSGGVLRAAKDLNRHAIGIELSEEYCADAVKKLRQEVLPLAAATEEPIQFDFGQ